MFNGTIDEVRIYDNALSAAEIQDLFSLRTTQKPPTLDVPSAVTATALILNTISANATTYNGAPPSFSWSVSSGMVSSSAPVAHLSSPSQNIVRPLRSRHF